MMRWDRYFTELDQKLRSMLETVVPTNLVSLPLRLAKTSIYATALDNDRYLRNIAHVSRGERRNSRKRR